MSRRGDPFTSGRHGDMRALEMSKSIVDATVRGVLLIPREVAQAVEVPTILEATELGRVM